MSGRDILSNRQHMLTVNRINDVHDVLRNSAGTLIRVESRRSSWNVIAVTLSTASTNASINADDARSIDLANLAVNVTLTQIEVG